jgi:hypothetical protein
MEIPVYVTLPEKFRREYATLWRSLFTGDLETIEVSILEHSLFEAYAYPLPQTEYCRGMGDSQRKCQLVFERHFVEATPRTETRSEPTRASRCAKRSLLSTGVRSLSSLGASRVIALNLLPLACSKRRSRPSWNFRTLSLGYVTRATSDTMH